EFPGGVWFCDLSQARSLDGLAHAVAHGLGISLGKADPLVQIGEALSAHGACLLIVDNVEQVTAHAEETIGRWLDRARQARILVTSRQVLGVPGEEVLTLDPLDVEDAAELFCRRAQAAGGDVESDPAGRASITALVKLLDGLPLAIELAAARVRVMSPQTLLRRMTARFELLVSRSGRTDRQATLRAAFDWSWDLLTLPEKVALAQLSVFEGSFTLSAAEAVIELPADCLACPTLDLVQSLVEKSLVCR